MSAVELSHNLQPEKRPAYLEMDINPDKRESERRSCNALIALSYFNQTKRYDAKVLNCGMGGMCFQSNLFLKPGATVCIRVRENPCSGSLQDSTDCLRWMSLAEVKWCNELPGTDSVAYSVGVKYQAQPY